MTKPKVESKVEYPDIASMSFEAALEELQSLSKKMSEGGMRLAESVTAYSRGVALSRHCQKLLDEAKDKIRVCDMELSKVVGDPEEGDRSSNHSSYSDPFPDEDEDTPF